MEKIVWARWSFIWESSRKIFTSLTPSNYTLRCGSYALISFHSGPFTEPSCQVGLLKSINQVVTGPGIGRKGWCKLGWEKGCSHCSSTSSSSYHKKWATSHTKQSLKRSLIRENCFSNSCSKSPLEQTKQPQRTRKISLSELKMVACTPIFFGLKIAKIGRMCTESECAVHGRALKLGPSRASELNNPLSLTGKGFPATCS